MYLLKGKLTQLCGLPSEFGGKAAYTVGRQLTEIVTKINEKIIAAAGRYGLRNRNSCVKLFVSDTSIVMNKSFMCSGIFATGFRTIKNGRGGDAFGGVL